MAPGVAQAVPAECLQTVRLHHAGNAFTRVVNVGRFKQPIGAQQAGLKMTAWGVYQCVHGGRLFELKQLSARNLPKMAI
jgi:hypothetical protein